MEADPYSAPWSAVGRLNIPNVSRCTAVMVAPHWAATAAHCLGVRLLGHPAPPTAIHLLLGYADGSFSRHLQPDAVHLDPDGAADPEHHRGSDLALLHFADTVSASLSPDTAPIVPGTAMVLGGYGQDRAERLEIDPACAAAGYQADADRRPMLRHDCNGTRGTSGGALLVQVAGRWRLAGLQVAGNVDGAGGLAIPGFAVASFLAAVRAAVR